MNKDPLEELFGPADETPEPVPARERLAYEQAERVRTAQLPAERGASRPAGAAPHRDRAAQAKPWIIVGIVAVLAIVASIVVVNIARGQGEPEPSTPKPTATQTEGTQQPDPEPTTPETEQPETEEPDADKVPSVDVGPTTSFPIGPWNASSEWPQRLGAASFVIPDATHLKLSGDLFNSFPESCAAMRTEWGATKQPDGTFAVAKPASRCEAAPDLYDQVWGLLDAWVKTIKVS
ncbi:hypothetical protein [Leucobacter chromiireducens]|uniref:hypothetical protein n=1 Tax=Leucobacter chromiireducens TaxID=283877 RepID=UPI001F154EF3|nr:hypothetical protein [Leucobacter chromiireducens]